MSSAADQHPANVVALMASIEKLVSQLFVNGNIANATTSIEEAIEASATSNAAEIGPLEYFPPTPLPHPK